MKKIIVLICLSIGVASNSSCSSSNSPSVVAENQTNLQSNGFKVGIFEDGAELRRWRISTGTLASPHYVYRVFPKDGTKEPEVTSVNLMDGKTPAVTVVIDGVKYTPVIEK